MEGWIKLHRSIVDWEWYDDTNAKVLFIHCILMANFRDTKWRGIDVKRGSFVTSFKNLANQTHMSEQSVRTSLEKLKKSDNITVKSTNRLTIITVSNYDSYQQYETVDQQTEQQETQQTINKQLTNNQQTTNNSVRIYKNDKNDKNEEEETHTCACACTREGEFDFFGFFRDRYHIGDTLLNDWMRVRNAANGINTETAALMISDEIGKAMQMGYTAEECIRKAVGKSWRDFEASWMNGDVKCVTMTDWKRQMNEYRNKKYGNEG